MPRVPRFAVGLCLMAAIAAAAAGCADSPTTPTCTYAWAQPSQAVTATGGTFQAALTTAASCSWTATADTSWVTLETTRGTGPGAVTLRVAANDDPSPRAAAVTVAGQRLDIRQEASPRTQTCVFDLWPATVTFGASGGAAPLAVTGPEGCRWTATTPDAWLTLAGASGEGAGPMIVSAAPNPAATARTSVVQVGTATVNVLQAGVGCDFDVSPTSRSIGAAGGRFDVAVTTSAGCDWQAASNAAWLTVSSSRGAGPGEVSITAAPLGGAATRTGNVSVAGYTITVTQSAAPTGCAYVVAPQAIAAPAAGSSYIVNVTTSASCAWTASSNASWVTIPLGQSGTGSGPIGLLVAANTTTTARTAVLQVGAETVTITQAGATPTCTYTLSPTAQAVSITGGRFQVTVTTGAACQWRATSSVPWLAITSGAQGTGTGTAGYSVPANTTQAVRTATITVGGQAFVVTQSDR